MIVVTFDFSVAALNDSFNVTTDSGKIITVAAQYPIKANLFKNVLHSCMNSLPDALATHSLQKTLQRTAGEWIY